MFIGIFAPFFLSPFLSGRCNRENFQESVLRDISKCFRSAPSYIEENMVSDPLFSFHSLPLLSSFLTLTLVSGSLCCGFHCCCHSRTNPSDSICSYCPSLASCCLEHSPDPVQSCLISLRQHNNSPGKKIGKHFRSELGSHSEGRRRQQLNCICLTPNCQHDSDPLSLCAHSS